MIKFIHSSPHFKYMVNFCINIIYLHIYELRIAPHNDLLLVGQIAQLEEHCTSIAEVKVGIPPVQAWIFLAFLAAVYKQR